MSASPLVSVILPTRDRPASLRRALASVCVQTHRELEVIVVDNARSGERGVGPDLPAPADSRVRIIRAARARNAAGARNAGLAAAGGDYVTFLDDDDTYDVDKIARQLALARESSSPLVLCGARFHVQGRAVVRHCETALVEGDALLTQAGLGTPFLLHRREVPVRFDEQLDAGEDYHYAHALLAHFGLRSVPVVPQPLVEVYQNVPAGPRTNLQGEAGWRAARRIWWQFGPRFSRAARRLYLVRALIARAKLRGETGRLCRLLPALWSAGGIGQWRYAANAVVVSLGWGRGRWVT